MPAVKLEIEWPDGEVAQYYSPSSIVANYFRPGERMLIDDLQKRGALAFGLASERVRLKFGFACSAAAENLFAIQTKINQHRPTDQVVIRAIINDGDHRPQGEQTNG